MSDLYLFDIDGTLLNASSAHIKAYQEAYLQVFKINVEKELLLKNFIFQVLLATGTIFLLLSFLTHGDMVIIASIGSTAFILFVIPNNITSTPWHVIGGHLIGIFSGIL